MALVGFGLNWREQVAALQQSKVAYFRPLIIVGIWFMTFPLAASLTDQALPNEVRAYNFVPLPQLLAGCGGAMAWAHFARLGQGWRWAGKVFAVVGLVVFGLFSQLSLSYFFGPPLLETNQAAKNLPYNLGLRPVLQKVSGEARPCDQIWLEPTNQAYIYYLFLTQYSPPRFQQAVKGQQVDDGGWLRVDWFNAVHFGVPGTDKHNAPPLPGCTGQASRLFFLSHNTRTGPEWREIAVTRNKSGEAVWKALLLEPKSG